MKTLSTLAIILSAALPLSARSAADFFAAAPDSLVSYLPVNGRLDMADYYSYGSNHGANDANETMWHITSLSDRSLTIAQADSATIQIAVMVAAPSDTAIAVVTTVPLPARDSRVEWFKTDWTPLKRQSAPQYTDWLSDDAFSRIDNLEYTLPFVTAEAVADPGSASVVYTNTAGQFLTASDLEAVKPFLTPTLTYRYAKGRVKPSKP